MDFHDLGGFVSGADMGWQKWWSIVRMNEARTFAFVYYRMERQ